MACVQTYHLVHYQRYCSISHYLKNDLKYKHSAAGATGTLPMVPLVRVRTRVLPWYPPVVSTMVFPYCHSYQVLVWHGIVGRVETLISILETHILARPTASLPTRRIDIDYQYCILTIIIIPMVFNTSTSEHQLSIVGC